MSLVTCECYYGDYPNHARHIINEYCLTCRRLSPIGTRKKWVCCGGTECQCGRKVKE
jgi:hypothetical protein